MPPSSRIRITCNSIDITRYVVFADTTFELVGSAVPGSATLVIRDRERSLDFTIGQKIILEVDNVVLWGGLVMDIARQHFFPVVDTTDIEQVTTRQWVLTCADFNIYLQKRVLRDPNNYLGSLIPTTPAKLGQVIRESVQRWMDIPSGMTYLTHIDDTNYDYPADSPLLDQGRTWKDQFDFWRRHGAYVYYIDAGLRLHFHGLRNVVAPWGFSDKPKGNAIGFREGSIREDGMQMVTDALVWGGFQYNDGTEDQIVFARYPQSPATDRTVRGEHLDDKVEEQALANLNTYGRFQRAERHIGETGYYEVQDVQLRAYTIVAGETGTVELRALDSGLGRPVWEIALTWFAHDVPNKQHLHPDHIVDLTFYTLGDGSTPLSLSLPLRTVSISFPTLPSSLDPEANPETYVRFDGTFGISYADTRFLWRFLINRSPQLGQVAATGVASVTNTAGGAYSGSTTYGAKGTFFPNEDPDGVGTVFTLPTSYLTGTTEVYVNGLLWRLNVEYLESNPATGQITFYTAPHPDDIIYVICRTGAV